MTTKSFKKLLEEKKIRQWQIADALGKSEAWLTRKLRYEMTADFEKELLEAVKVVQNANS